MIKKLIYSMVIIGVVVLVWANFPEERLASGLLADRVLVEKSLRRLTLYRQNTVLKAYQISLGGNPMGPKQQEGDRRTPEGKYLIDRRNAASAFHLALHVSYPDAKDQASAKERQVSPGGDIMIHGIRNGIGLIGKLQRTSDWTAGCIAVTNPEIEEIWNTVPDGTPIEILP